MLLEVCDLLEELLISNADELSLNGRISRDARTIDDKDRRNRDPAPFGGIIDTVLLNYIPLGVAKHRKGSRTLALVFLQRLRGIGAYGNNLSAGLPKLLVSSP